MPIFALMISQWDIIDKLKNKLKDHPVLLKKFKEYEIDPEEFMYYPMCFKDLDVSARTEHGCIYFNSKFLDKFPDPEDLLEELAEYCVHEVVHIMQQTTGNKPTKGSADDNYLANPAEIEGFCAQTEYISQEEGKEEAEEYIDQVLEHHDYPEKDKSKKKKQLLKDASKQLKFDFAPVKQDNKKNLSKSERFKEIIDKIEESKGKKILDAFNQGEAEVVPRPSKPLRHDEQYHQNQLAKLWNKVKNSLNRPDQNEAMDFGLDFLMKKYVPQRCQTCGHSQGDHFSEPFSDYFEQCEVLEWTKNFRSAPERCPCVAYIPAEEE